MAECERKQNRTIYEQQITTDNPDAYANLKLTIEGISETGVAELRKKFLGLWQEVERTVQKETNPLK